jgi:hypothetical protein
MKKYIVILFLLLASAVYSQETEFKGMSTRFSGADSWKSWSIDLSSGSGYMSTVFSGDDAWKDWRISLPDGEGSIRTIFSGDDAWKTGGSVSAIPAEILIRFSPEAIPGKSGASRTGKQL